MKQIEETPWLYPLVVDYARRKLCKCNPKHYLLDAQNKLVYCRTCGAIVDPFDALLNMARDAERLQEALHSYRQAADQERQYYERYKGINDISRNFKKGLVPICPKCMEPIDLLKIKTYVSFTAVYGGEDEKEK